MTEQKRPAITALDPNGSPPSKALEEVHLRRLDQCRRAFVAGSFLALYEALDYCLSSNLRVEKWIVQGAMLAIELMSPFNQRKKRGRASHPVARNRQDLIHLSRYYAVLEVRERQEFLAKELEALSREDGLSRELKRAQELSNEVGTTWLEAYEAARTVLKNTAAYAGPEAIKRSYQLVRRHMSDDGHAFKYYLVGSKTLTRMGLRRI